MEKWSFVCLFSQLLRKYSICWLLQVVAKATGYSVVELIPVFLTCGQKHDQVNAIIASCVLHVLIGDRHINHIIFIGDNVPVFCLQVLSPAPKWPNTITSGYY